MESFQFHQTCNITVCQFDVTKRTVRLLVKKGSFPQSVSIVW